MKTLYKSFSGTMSIGQKEAKVSIDLEVGNVLVGTLFAEKPSETVTIKINDGAGSAIVDASNYQDWQQRQGGDYITSKKPMGFSAGRKVTVVANSNNNQTADWDFEVLLIIQQQ